MYMARREEEGVRASRDARATPQGVKSREAADPGEREWTDKEAGMRDAGRWGET